MLDHFYSINPLKNLEHSILFDETKISEEGIQEYYHNGHVIGTAKANIDPGRLPTLGNKKFFLVPHPSDMISNWSILSYVIVARRNWHVYNISTLETSHQFVFFYVCIFNTNFVQRLGEPFFFESLVLSWFVGNSKSPDAIEGHNFPSFRILRIENSTIGEICAQ